MDYQESKMATFGKLSLVVLFWIFLVVECFALFTNRLWLYGIARAVLVPTLFFRVFSERYKEQIDPMFFISLLFAMLADVFTMYGDSLSVGYVGLSMFSISYLSLACFVIHAMSILDARYIILVMGTIVFVGLDMLWIMIPKSRDAIFYAQIAMHTAVIIFLLVSIIVMFTKIKNAVYPFIFLIAIIFVCLANSLYGISLLKFNLRNYTINMLVGLSHGLYMYLFANGAIRTIAYSDPSD